VATRAAVVVLLALSLVPAAAPAESVQPAPRLLDLRVTNGSTPFAGDRRLLTTVSPNGDRFRDRAIVSFKLTAPATVELDVLQTLNVKRGVNTVREIWSESATFAKGRHRMAWTPARTVPAGTYVLELTVTDLQGRRRIYNDFPLGGHVHVVAPVVRIQRITVSLRPSYAPGDTAVVSISTDARHLQFEILTFRGGSGSPDAKTAATPLAPPATLAWTGHRSGPSAVRIRIGDWPSGLYFVRITARDGRVGYAPFVVRPRQLSASKIAVVLSTNTWQAYNFTDADGDGWGDSWYVNGAFRTVDVGRPYLDAGVPYRFGDFDAAIIRWLSARGNLDFLSDADLDRIADVGRPYLDAGVPYRFGDFDAAIIRWLSARGNLDFLSDADLDWIAGAGVLARDYDLIVFPGHEEYVTAHEYDLIKGYRDLGGNLMFLSANNLFWKVVFHGRVMRRVGQWRSLGRSEAGVVGVQYVASNYGAQQAPYIADTGGAPWAFAGTGLATGDRFGRYGYEIDMRAAATPPGTVLLASIPDLMGPGRTAEMTYYETPRGAKVFAAGALNFASSVDQPVVARLLDNVWARLSRP
jgi:hypothetical protein